MRILTFDGFIASALQALGHDVIDLRPEERELSLPECIASLPQPPDCVIQTEQLHRRLLLRDVDKAPCPTAFIALDVHLNLYWHRDYARLFDYVFTPHHTLFAALPPEWQHPALHHLPPMGITRPWVPFSKRQHDLALWARLTPHRQIRTWMVELLQKEIGLHLRDDLSYGEMLDLYCHSRMIPNESISFEVNFRLLEGTSCGALVLSPDVGPDQDSLFTPGKEILVYHDGLELLEQAAWGRKNPQSAERMGRSAWERVQKDHLPEQRAMGLLRAMGFLPSTAATGNGKRATGDAARELFWRTQVQLTRQGTLRTPISTLLLMGEELPRTPSVMATQLRLLAESKRSEQGLELCRLLYETGLGHDSPDCAVAASLSALRLGDFDLARRFWFRYDLACGAGKERGQGVASAPPPENGVALCLAWAEALRRAQRLAQPGFGYDPAKNHIPESAYECIQLALFIDSESLEAQRKALQLMASLPAYAAFRLGHLASVSLLDQENWRLQTEFGLSSLRACRVAEGLAELRAAMEKARSAGKQNAFERMLAAQPSGAYTLAKLLAPER